MARPRSGRPDDGSLFIDGAWREGRGEVFASTSCARRLVLPRGDAILEALQALVARLTIGEWDSQDPRFMGSLISVAAADRVRAAVAALVARGARVLFAGTPPAGLSPAFVAPTLLDVTEIAVADEEIFGPVLQVVRVDDFETAIARANDTAHGLAAPG